jgi:hypothetical protein
MSNTLDVREFMKFQLKYLLVWLSKTNYQINEVFQASNHLYKFFSSTKVGKVDVGFSTFCNLLLKSILRAEFVTEWDTKNTGILKLARLEPILGHFGAM